MLILIVDDDPLAIELIATIAQAAGHQTRVAEQALEALEQLDHHPDIELIISDMHMPLMSGIELYQELCERDSWRPFVLLSGDAPESLLAQAPGLAGCLVKDFSLETALPHLLDQLQAHRAGD
jgi:CheY-like chemotaxis protein